MLYGDLIEMADPEDGSAIWKLQYEDAIVDDEEHTTSLALPLAREKVDAAEGEGRNSLFQQALPKHRS